MKKKITRLEANREILKLLNGIVEAQPDWRFHQILQNMDVNFRGADQFFEESVETLERLKKTAVFNFK